MVKLPKITNRKIRISIVGCGRISSNHFAAIDIHNSDFELVSICDIDENLLIDLKKKYKVHTYSSLQDMLESEDLDVVVLCTPSGLHAEQAILASEFGVNVVTEKPMATRWHDGLNMVKACDRAGVHLFVVKQNRKNTTLQLLKRAIDQRRFGKINMIQINVFWTRPQEYYDQAGWRGTWEFDGGALMNQASHYVDLLDWLIGPVEKINCFSSTTRDIEVEDTAVMNIKWRNGALGSVSVTMLTYPKNLEGSITILGNKGTVKIGGVAVNEIQCWDFEDSQDYDKSIKEANYETTSVYGFGHPAYYKNIIEVLRGDALPQTNGREGLRSLEILIGAYISSRNGTIVPLPLEY